MRRKAQQLTKEECVEILLSKSRGVLSVMGDDEYPYGIPINYFYDEKENKIYFHGAKSGHKNDAIARSDKASFCVMQQEEKRDGEWFYRVKSVIAFGRVAVVNDEEKKKEICSRLCYALGQTEEYAESEWEKYNKAVNCLAFSVEHMTGKRVKEE